MLVLQLFKERPGVLHQQTIRVGLILAVEDVHVKLLGPRDEAMPYILRHGLVLLQLFQEDVIVKSVYFLHVAEDNVFFTGYGGRNVVGDTLHLLQEWLDTALQVFNVCSFSLQQFCHDKSVNKESDE